MSATKKAKIMQKIAMSRAPTLRALRELGVPKSTYYR